MSDDMLCCVCYVRSHVCMMMKLGEILTGSERVMACRAADVNFWCVC